VTDDSNGALTMLAIDSGGGGTTWYETLIDYGACPGTLEEVG
jgi:hypothetical protein